MRVHGNKAFFRIVENLFEHLSDNSDQETVDQTQYPFLTLTVATVRLIEPSYRAGNRFSLSLSRIPLSPNQFFSNKS
jgi:hypothetical protein